MQRAVLTPSLAARLASFGTCDPRYSRSNASTSSGWVHSPTSRKVIHSILGRTATHAALYAARHHVRDGPPPTVRNGCDGSANGNRVLLDHVLVAQRLRSRRPPRTGGHLARAGGRRGAHRTDPAGPA